MAAFPSGYNLSRGSGFSSDKSVITSVQPDGGSVQIDTGAGEYITINCSIEHISSADHATLKSFLRTNRNTNPITWTIDSIDYTGIFIGGYSESLIGNVYSLSFTYRAAEV
jgi:hypothetical protein